MSLVVLFELMTIIAYKNRDEITLKELNNRLEHESSQNFIEMVTACDIQKTDIYRIIKRLKNKILTNFFFRSILGAIVPRFFREYSKIP